MSERNEAPGRERDGALGAADMTAAVNAPASSSTARKSIEHEGSLLSHLLYGLGTLLFVLPLLIPGIPMFWLTVAYGSLIAAFTIGFVCWMLFNNTKARRGRN